ncbi:hypothetical protein [Bdellovibrio sp.]|uniref:hypothetical protein n=1 Tax=Bdellovibrio TaxID=958 RepID=UPI003221D34D
MKKSLMVLAFGLLGSQLAMAESIICKTEDQKVTIELGTIKGDIVGALITGTDSENADIMVVETEKAESSLKVTMLDLTNAKGLELNVAGKDQKLVGTLTDMGAPGNASTDYAVTCEVK